LQVLQKNKKGEWKAIAYHNIKSQIPSHRYQGKESEVMGAYTVEGRAVDINFAASCHDGAVADRHITKEFMDMVKAKHPHLPHHNLILKPLDIPEDYQEALGEAQLLCENWEIGADDLARREGTVELCETAKLLNDPEWCAEQERLYEEERARNGGVLPIPF
jgi:hypothetical protein